ncbi:hypothetical protein L195_g043746 [Trifolium pratense]|uniref:Uncharacterized protein n=1 Tax=Trifolium pratense TaxID=57577 RepID=A0A2K3MA59_TRIPR|nr:hypothetical protein L195_g043746 [Trifolium pratense]
MGVGFAAGFWGICGSLFLIRKWRHAYFRWQILKCYEDCRGIVMSTLKSSMI